MSKIQTLRAFVKQRLTAATEEIFEVFERTIAEYEEELCGQRKLLDAVLNPDVRLQRADVQQLVVGKDKEQQYLEEPPELQHIKAEVKQLWTRREEEQLQATEEEEAIKFIFTPVPVKCEDEERRQSSSLYQAEEMQTETDEEDYGEPEADDSCDWEESSGPQSGLNNEDPVSYAECEARKAFSSSEYATNYDHKGVDPSVRGDTAKKAFMCSFCRLYLAKKADLIQHMRIHSGEKPFSCSTCGKRFAQKSNLTRHMTIHTGEKPFSCSVCHTYFSRKANVKLHMGIHTGEKAFRCSVCGKRFERKSNLTQHMTVHTGEKPFSCSVCDKRFNRRGSLRTHMRVHSGEKAFACTFCDKNFSQLQTFKKHKCVNKNGGSNSTCGNV